MPSNHLQIGWILLYQVQRVDHLCKLETAADLAQIYGNP